MFSDNIRSPFQERKFISFQNLLLSVGFFVLLTITSLYVAISPVHFTANKTNTTIYQDGSSPTYVDHSLVLARTCYNRVDCKSKRHVLFIVATIYRENRLLITDKLVEFQHSLVQNQDFVKITNPIRKIYRIFPQFKNQKMSTCNWLDLETLGCP